MVVNNLDGVGIASPPDKTDAPLIIDANTVLPLAVAMECFEAITGRRGKVADFYGSIQLPQLPLGNSLDGAPSPDGVTPVQELCLLGAKALYHRASL
jgi:hypothetical protein